MSELNKENICCSICLDVFKKPRVLSCLHTFCCQCLQNHIDQQPNACENRGFNCPICRQFVEIPNPTGGWAAQMKCDFNVESKVDGVKPDYKELEKESEVYSEAGLTEVCEDTETSTFTLLNTIDAGTVSVTWEKSNMCISDILILKQRGLQVFVISYYWYVKAIWYDPSKDIEVDSCLRVNGNNLRMTKISESKIAVSGTDACGQKYCRCTDHMLCVTIINVQPQLIIEETISNTISKSNGFSCITCIRPKPPSQTDTRLLIAHSGMLSLTDMHGKGLKALTVDFTGKKLFENANYMVTAPSGNIIISDNVQHCVVCITLDRELLWKYPVKNPRGLYCDEHSNVFIADTDNKKVIVLSRDGRYAKDVLTDADDLTKPMGLYYDPYRGILYICDGNSLIRIFKANTAEDCQL